MRADIRRRFAWVYEKLSGFLNMIRKNRDCLLSEEEIRLAGQARKLAGDFFGVSAGETLAALSPRRRMALLEDFVYSLLDLYGMSSCDVIITDSEQIFSDAEIASCMGKCEPEGGVIYLNSHFLLQENEALLRKCGASAVHEVRHMIQWHAVLGDLKLHIPRETVEKWRKNLSEEYIRASVNFEDYYNQPVEADARNFAYLVLEGL